MPEGRLERTRDMSPVVPPCVRLGHAWAWDGATLQRWCIRCRLIDPQDSLDPPQRLGGWNVIEGDPA